MHTARSPIRLVSVFCVLLAGGCYLESEGAIPPPEYAYGYAPVYYDGYVVYYDDVGRPFYYVDGAQVWVPRAARSYPGLVGHWHAFGPRYHEWYAHGGPRFRGYRFHGHRR
ncbi:MAG TPA: hypothetical protein VHZ95_15170 [Polyangiales bacterium]|nr:hypothetical protein [Polyangiales bacterium]